MDNNICSPTTRLEILRLRILTGGPVLHNAQTLTTKTEKRQDFTRLGK